MLVLTMAYPPHHLGGYEVICADVVSRLVARGHQVSVLTSDLRVPGVEGPDGEGPHGEGPDGEVEAEVHRRLQIYYRDDALHAPSLRARLGMERANQSALGALLARARPEVVSVWHMGAMSLGLLTTLVEAGLPLVYSICDDWLVYGLQLDAWARLFNGRPLPRLRRALGTALRPALGVPTTLVDVGASGSFCFISRATRAGAERSSPWSFPDSSVVHSGIDRSLFAPPPGPEGERPWRWRLLYVGRYDPRKGIETALRALPALPQATLEVRGRGDAGYRAALGALAEELGVGGRTHLGTGVDRQDLPRLYAGADALVFPSVWDEPFGLVPLEAMACGTPVVATGAGGSGEVLRHGVNCLRFRPGDARELTAALSGLAGDPDLRRRLVAGGLRTAEELDIGHLADAIEARHEAARSGAGRGSPG